MKIIEEYIFFLLNPSCELSGRDSSDEDSQHIFMQN